MFKKVDPKKKFPKMEEEILSFWQKNKVFEKSVEQKPKNKAFSFYDGPPFATGTPHYGHLLAGTIKDVIPRFKTMQGYRVERIWGWDTHGLPIENIVEQELDFKSKTQIEEYGVDKFNEKCKTKVLKYAQEWEKIVERTGRWVDMKNAYLTMDLEYMESVWWVFKTLWDKELIYEGHKVMPYCPRCSTALSNFEVGMGYVDKRDKAITVKFELLNQETDNSKQKTYLLAWTTTPWTLPGNLALAVNPKIKYVKVKLGKDNYILAKDRLDAYPELGKAKEEIKGKDLVGKRYKPIFNYYKNPKKAFEIIAGTFVSTADGTGIVHIAPAFGEDDYRVARENGLDFFIPVDDLGRFTVDVPDYSGRSVVELETNQEIIDDLKKQDRVIKEEDFTHSYPHCWRCDTPLIYRAINSYFVNVGKTRKNILALNKKIHWVPDFVGSGRFHKMLEGAPDWNISRQRFWGTPLPVWKCEDCNKDKVFGSVAELEKSSGKKIKDLHLHFLKNIEVPCECGGKAKLLGDVLDCWFESGSMPYAQVHYPFENKDKFGRDFPADFIAEGIDQTRGWFNSLLILSTDLFGKESFENVVVNGIVLAENGQKMSKRLKNYPDPIDIVNKYGADAMRFYLMSSPASKAGDLWFSEKGVDEIVKKIVLTLWNSYSFFATYSSLDKFVPKGKLSGDNVLDKWVVSKANNLIKNVTLAMEQYDLSLTCRHLLDFMDELSNWYIRRSRKRFWKSENDADKYAAYETLYFVLTSYIKLLAPLMPFVSEEIYQGLVVSVDKKAPKSVHLSDWPKADKKLIHDELEEKMTLMRNAIEMGLSTRAEKGIKVRQPLAELIIHSPLGPKQNLLDVVVEEVNVKKVMLKKAKALKVELDTKITPELKAEGIAREFVRFVQNSRKKAGFNVEDRIITYYETDSRGIKDAIDKFAENKDYSIKKETLSVELSWKKESAEYKDVLKINGEEIWIGLSKTNPKH